MFQAFIFLLADGGPLPPPIANELGFCYCNSTLLQYTMFLHRCTFLMSNTLILLRGSLPVAFKISMSMPYFNTIYVRIWG